MIQNYISVQRISDIPRLSEEFKREHVGGAVDLDTGRVLNLGEFTIAMLLDDNLMSKIEEKGNTNLFTKLFATHPQAFINKVFSMDWDSYFTELTHLEHDEVMDRFNKITPVTKTEPVVQNTVTVTDTVIEETETVMEEHEEEIIEKVEEHTELETASSEEEEDNVDVGNVSEEVFPEVKEVTKPYTETPSTLVDEDMISSIEQIVRGVITREVERSCKVLQLDLGMMEKEIVTNINEQSIDISPIVDGLDNVIKQSNKMRLEFQNRERRYTDTIDAQTKTTEQLIKTIDVLSDKIKEVESIASLMSRSQDLQEQIINRYVKVSVFETEEIFEDAIDKLRLYGPSKRLVDTLADTLQKMWHSGDRQLVDTVLYELLNQI